MRTNGFTALMFILRLIGGLLALMLLLIALSVLPIWTPQALSFIGERDGVSDIVLVDLQTGVVANVTGTPYREWSLAWAANRRLAYVASIVGTRQVGDSLFTMTRWGQAQAVETPGALMNFGVVWHPSGNALTYFSSFPGNYSDIFTLVLDTGAVTNLTRTPQRSETFPVWLPAGDGLLYLRDGDLYHLHLASDDLRLIASLSGDIEAVSAAPDNQQIAFLLPVTNANGITTYALYHTRLAGGDPRLIPTPATLRRMPPAWSPDSRHLAVALTDGTLALVALESATVRVLADDARRSTPTWSADGQRLAFVQGQQVGWLDVASGAATIIAPQWRQRSAPGWVPSRSN